MTSHPVKRPHLGGYSATSGCACAHPSKGTQLFFQYMTLKNIFHFPYFFRPQRLKYRGTWRYKTSSRTFFPYFFILQCLKYQLLAFLVHDVIKHFPVLIQTTSFEISVTCFLCIMFPYLKKSLVIRRINM